MNFKEVKIGEYFKINNQLFLKIRPSYNLLHTLLNAVEVKTGKLWYISFDKKVEK